MIISQCSPLVSLVEALTTARNFQAPLLLRFPMSNQPKVIIKLKCLDKARANNTLHRRKCTLLIRWARFPTSRSSRSFQRQKTFSDLCLSKLTLSQPGHSSILFRNNPRLLLKLLSKGLWSQHKSRRNPRLSPRRMPTTSP